jgi:hypothetical protein
VPDAHVTIAALVVRAPLVESVVPYVSYSVSTTEEPEFAQVSRS